MYLETCGKQKGGGLTGIVKNRRKMAIIIGQATSPPIIRQGKIPKF